MEKEVPDFLANMAARVIWDNLHLYPNLDPELVQQVSDFGKRDFSVLSSVSCFFAQKREREKRATKGKKNVFETRKDRTNRK